MLKKVRTFPFPWPQLRLQNYLWRVRITTENIRKLTSIFFCLLSLKEMKLRYNPPVLGPKRWRVVTAPGVRYGSYDLQDPKACIPNVRIYFPGRIIRGKKGSDHHTIQLLRNYPSCSAPNVPDYRRHFS